MNIYIIKHPTGEILAVNRTLHGCAMELYGLDVVDLAGDEASEEALSSALTSAPSIECKTSEDLTLTVERHYLGN